MSEEIAKLKYAYEHSQMVSSPEMREELGRQFDSLIAEVQAVAWDEGQEMGWGEAQECWAVDGMVGDLQKYSSTPNPYRGKQ